MRYFLITFSIADRFSVGTITLESEGFFSHSTLLSEVRKQQPHVKGVIVMNIFEFADADDYKTYIGITNVEDKEEIYKRWYKSLQTYVLERMRLPPDVINDILISDEFLRARFNEGETVQVAVMKYFEGVNGNK